MYQGCLAKSWPTTNADQNAEHRTSNIEHRSPEPGARSSRPTTRASTLRLQSKAAWRFASRRTPQGFAPKLRFSSASAFICVDLRLGFSATTRLFRIHPEKLRRTRNAEGLRIGLACGRLPIRRGQARGLFERARAAPGQAQRLIRVAEEGQ